MLASLKNYHAKQLNSCIVWWPCNQRFVANMCFEISYAIKANKESLR